MNIQEVRQKFPQYNDLSDQELASALHSKFYSDIPFSQFSQQIGLNYQEPETGFSAARMVSNIPSSAAGIAQDIIRAFASPVETAKNVGNLGMGLFSKAVSGGLPEEKYAEALGQMYKQRYGGTKEALKTLETDPVGVASDVAGLFTGGGLVAGKIPGLVKAGETAAKIGTAIDPLLAAKNATLYGVGKVLPESLPISLYNSAAKFGTTLGLDERNKLVTTALENNLMPTDEGVGKLVGIQKSLGNKIDELISAADATGTNIPRSAVYKHISDLKKTLGGPTLDADKRLAEINSIAKSFNQYMDSLGKTSLTPSELQKFKTSAYSDINFEARNQTGTRTKEETYKAMARAAKEALENVSPELKDVNAQYGALENLREPLMRSAARIENRDFIGIGTPTKVFSGSSVAGPAGAAVGAAQSLLDMPKTKAYLALKLYDLQKKGAGQLLSSQPSTAAILQALRMGGAFNQGLLGE